MYLFESAKLNLDEVVFEPRNKAYGAYALRKSYPDHLRRGVYFTLLPLILITVAAPLQHWLFPGMKPAIPPLSIPEKPKSPLTDVITCGSGFTFLLSDAMNGFHIVVDRKVKSDPAKKQEVRTIERNPGTMGLTGGVNVTTLGGGLPGLGSGIIKGGSGTDVIIDFAEFMPEFPGGLEAMYEYIRNNLTYPQQARDNQIQGKVVVSFVVMPDGGIQMANLERGIGYGCDAEALRVVNEMPVWKPGIQNGKKVPVRLMLPLLFQIN